MFTLVVTIVVVVGSIAGVIATVGVFADQTATAAALRPSGPETVAAVPVAALPAAPVVAPLPLAFPPETRLRRLRSALALAVLTAFLGALLAVGISATLIVLSLALQRAAG